MPLRECLLEVTPQVVVQSLSCFLVLRRDTLEHLDATVMQQRFFNVILLRISPEAVVDLNYQ